MNPFRDSSEERCCICGRPTHPNFDELKKCLRAVKAVKKAPEGDGLRGLRGSDSRAAIAGRS
jgi:hypothetical protein